MTGGPGIPWIRPAFVVADKAAETTMLKGNFKSASAVLDPARVKAV
jgi:hypothetical protein